MKRHLTNPFVVRDLETWTDRGVMTLRRRLDGLDRILAELAGDRKTSMSDPRVSFTRSCKTEPVRRFERATMTVTQPGDEPCQVRCMRPHDPDPSDAFKIIAQVKLALSDIIDPKPRHDHLANVRHRLDILAAHALRAAGADEGTLLSRTPWLGYMARRGHIQPSDFDRPDETSEIHGLGRALDRFTTSPLDVVLNGREYITSPLIIRVRAAVLDEDPLTPMRVLSEVATDPSATPEDLAALGLATPP